MQEITTLIQSNNIDSISAKNLQDTFMPFFTQAEEWKKKAGSLVVTSIDQKEEMKLAREARLALKNIRVNVEKARKQMKEESLRKGKAIDGIANVIKFLIVPIEDHLQAQEDFIKLEEAKRIEELKEHRESALAPYEVDTTYFNLGEMTEESFSQLLNNSRIAFEQRKEQERKTEEDRIAKEKAEAEERERIRQENARLKAEAEAREKAIAEERRKQEEERKKQEEIARKEREKLEAEIKAKEQEAAKERAKVEAEKKKEREAAEAKLKAEREQKARFEAELKAKKEAEEKARMEAEAKEKAKRLAPDKQKLEELAKEMAEFELPEVSNPEARKVLDNVRILLNKTAAYINEKKELL